MNPESQSKARISVIGCGGIGGVLCCHLLRSDVAFSVVTTNEEIARVWRSSGPSLDGKPVGRSLPEAQVLTSLRQAEEKMDLIFVAVQAPVVDELAEEIRDCLKPDGLVIVLSNGLCEERLALVVGQERVIGAVVAWGARMPKPGQYLRTSSGGFLVGGLGQTQSRELSRVIDLLETVGPVRLTNNLRGARFSKLTINCAITALGTIGGKTLGALLLQTEARRLALQLMYESAEVAKAEGVTLERLTRVDLAGLASRAHAKRRDQKMFQHALLLAAGIRYRKLRSSMLAAMERGKRPAIDYINGEIVRRGERLGVPVPFNRAATQVIWDIHAGRQKAGVAALREVSRRATAEVKGD